MASILHFLFAGHCQYLSSHDMINVMKLNVQKNLTTIHDSSLSQTSKVKKKNNSRLNRLVASMFRVILVLV